MGRSSAADDASAALVAAAAQDAAGAKLAVDQVSARIAAAKKALDEAVAKLRAMKKGQPGKVFAKCLVDAAQVTYEKASKQGGSREGQRGASRDGEPKSGSFWTNSLVGPVPGWGVAAGGVGLGVIFWRILRGKWGF